jgi:hypothetical protein
MAAIAGTVVVNTRYPVGNRWRVQGTFTFSTAYFAGGDLFTAVQMGMDTIEDIQTGPALNSGGATVALITAAKLNANSNGGQIQLFTANGTPGTTVALAEWTTADNHLYSCGFEAFGF